MKFEVNSTTSDLNDKRIIEITQNRNIVFIIKKTLFYVTGKN